MMAPKTESAYITFTHGPFKNFIYKLKNPDYPVNILTEFRVTDHGNTLEDPKGYIIGNFIGIEEDPDLLEYSHPLPASITPQ
jgi:hypothetical protein